MYESDKMWTRVCPQCNLKVIHKSKAKCHGAERLSSPCVKCSRSNIGKANSKTDTCPICNIILKIPIAYHKKITELEDHAQVHQTTPIHLWLLKHNTEPKKCRCGCNEITEWVNWWNGYNDFIIGHNANIYSSYDKEEAEKLALTRGSNWRGKPSIWTGQTKENNASVKKRSEKIAKTRKQRIDEGKITFEYSRFNKEEIELKLSKNVNIILDRIENYTNSHHPNIWVHCRTCDWFEKVKLYIAEADRCPKCSPIGSNGQNQIADFVTSLGFKVVKNIRGIIGRQELDIFVPEKMLAIEFNDLYWHCEAAGKDQFYHHDKQTRCSSVGIKLIHVFEDEWNNKQSFIKGIISHHLGARKPINIDHCVINEISSQRSMDFLQQDNVGCHNFALFHNNEIVSTLAANASDDTLEVIASSDVNEIYIKGSLNALTAHALNALKLLRARVTIDNRFNTASLWINAGWTQAHIGEEMCWFTDGRTRHIDRSVFSDQERVSPIWGCRPLTFVKRF